MQYLIIGLGNIGPEYERTRHNIGFMVLDRLVAKQGSEQFKLDKQAFFARTMHKGRILNLIKPTTYMNLSGKAVRFWMQHLKIPKENILVITDDLAIPYGVLRLKGKGSGGGHNGLGNIQEVLNSTEYPRLRFGIGDKFAQGKQIDYVLGNFSIEEQQDLELNIERSVDAVFQFCSIGLERAMNVVNTKEQKEPKPSKEPKVPKSPKDAQNEAISGQSGEPQA